MDLKAGQTVKVDGDDGVISGIFPEGSGNYQGSQHAYIWVSRADQRFEPKMKGIAVPFCDIEKRIS